MTHEQKLFADFESGALDLGQFDYTPPKLTSGTTEAEFLAFWSAFVFGV